MKKITQPKMDFAEVFAEVFDSINEAQKFLKLNKIKKCKTVIIWNDYD